MQFDKGGVHVLKKYILFVLFLFTQDCVWFSHMSGSPAALFPSSCSWHQDYHKRGTSVKPALIYTHVRPIILKVVIKKHELLLFFYWNLLAKKGERPFNFIASRTLKYSLHSTFRFQPLCGRQDSWHLCMLLLFTMLFSLQMCAASDPSIPSDRSYWCAPSYRPVQRGSAVSECKLTILFWWGVPFSSALFKLRTNLPLRGKVLLISLKMLLTET